VRTKSDHEVENVFPLAHLAYEGPPRDRHYAWLHVPLAIAGLQADGEVSGRQWSWNDAVTVAWYVTVAKSAQLRSFAMWRWMRAARTIRGRLDVLTLPDLDEQTWADACASLHAASGDYASELAPADAMAEATRRGVAICIDEATTTGEQVYGEVTLVVRADCLLICFDRARFGERLIAALAFRLAHLLEQLLSAPATPIGSTQLLSDRERHWLWHEIGRGAPIEVEKSIVQVVREYAAANPERLAIRQADRIVTYRELVDNFARTATWLASSGVTAGDIVAVHGETSPELLYVWFALMALNATYLTVDARVTKKWKHDMLADAQVAHLVLLSDQTSADAATNIPLLRCNWAQISTSPPHEVRPPNLDAPAYCIYTSGSTGRPKGVLISQRSLSGYCQAIAATLLRDAGHEFAFLASPVADLPFTSLYGALYSGGCVRILPDESRLEPDALARELIRAPVDCLKIVPSHFHALAEASQGSDWWPRRMIIFGGESLYGSLVEQIRRAAPGLRIVNHYGPTETTVGALVNVLAGDAVPENVPVGRPLPGYHVIVLDDQRRLLPLGHIGELYIGGNGCALGYINDEALTQQRFVNIDFQQAARRFYRTGDRVRLNAEGEVVFLGRLDNQLKLRGHRVELEAIEAALRSMPGVAEVCVVAMGRDAAQHLVAFYTSSARLAPSELAASLRELLPDYMCPSRFEEMKRLPRTESGKIDRDELRKALPQEQPSAAAGNDIEGELASIWRELLQQPTLNQSGNFFDMGANSLLIIKARKRIVDTFAVDVKLVDFFRYTTIRTLSEHIARLREAVAEATPRAASGAS
jgi:amino acid adenylation domain-containing protein